MIEIVKVGLDIGGVLSKNPQIWRPLVLAWLASPAVEVHVLTDITPHERAVELVQRNGFPVPAERIHSCDYKAHSERCKAVVAAALGLHVLVDDLPGYLAVVGAPPVRLLVMPDPDLDYLAEDWETDGSEGDFGRTLQRAKTRP